MASDNYGGIVSTTLERLKVAGEIHTYIPNHCISAVGAAVPDNEGMKCAIEDTVYDVTLLTVWQVMVESSRTMNSG